MSRTASVFALLGASAAGIAAQAGPPPFALARAKLVNEVKAKLRSTDLASVAWGGYLAAEARLEACIPDLRARLAGLKQREGDEWHCAVSALLDALIQTDAVVPGEELVPFLDFSSATIVLLARKADGNRAVLLRMFRRHFEGQGPILGLTDELQACGNLLANLRDAAFELELLRTPLLIEVAVTDDGFSFRSTIGSSVSVCGQFRARDGFPPIARHELYRGNGPPALLVAPGPVAVFRARSWFHDGVRCSTFNVHPDRREARNAWLCQLLGASRRPLIDAIDRRREVEWKGAEPLRAFAQQCRHETEQAWRALVAACIEAKLLAADAAHEPLPRITIELCDERQHQATPLPELRQAPGRNGR
ncbi:MAG: hypothetical protein WAT39_17610 [Planctomycetota bacterium]